MQPGSLGKDQYGYRTFKDNYFVSCLVKSTDLLLAPKNKFFLISANFLINYKDNL